MCAGLTACTADTTIQEEDVVDNQTPMAFGTSLSTSESAATRAATSLAAGFKVGTWKKFKQEGEQLVMDGSRPIPTSSVPYRLTSMVPQSQHQA